MNVAIFRESLLPYSETFIAAQAASLRRYQPTLVALKRLPNSVPLPVPSLVLPEERGLPAGGMTAFKLFSQVPRRWDKLLREQQFSLMHAHFGPDALWGLPLARRLALPLVVTFHGYDVNPTQTPLSHGYRYYQARRGHIFRSAKRVVAVSDWIRQRLETLGCPPSKIVTHYIGIDLNYFTPTRRESEPVVLAVGRLIESKGVRDLLQAMVEVQRRIPGARVVIVGGGPLEEDLKAEASRLGVRAEFTGPQTPEQVRGWMERAALFCLPSRHEAFGLVYAEAQAMQLPVVAYAHGGVPEAVRDKETGFLAPTGDKVALARHMITLLGDEPLRIRMGQAGREHVQRHFNLQHQTHLLEGIYDQILS
ncbi:glycosyltransferase [Deinococcus daejeonensis]|uniref:Glycosyl transferase family 1 n=1 Tax=Deinococcus daejeonensis TaxID=1007098 RepID=A0ABQ2J6H6_9DEIO|nr:glycosyltransferase [Deinococcus daejeonensis]GGN38173.1 glycosyl transferase family 1 [Deinococcus daejeonensis]